VMLASWEPSLHLKYKANGPSANISKNF